MSFVDHVSRKSSERIAFYIDLLRRAETILDDARDYHRTLPRLGTLLVPTFAQWGFIDLGGSPGGRDWIGLRPPPQPGVDTEDVAWGEPRADPEPPHPILQVLRSGRPERLEDVTDDWLDRHLSDAALRRQVQDVGLRSAIYVPLRLKGEPTGLLGLHRTGSAGEGFDEHDLRACEVLADMITSAVRNARYTTELEEELDRRQKVEGRLNQVVRYQSARVQELKTVMNTVPAGVWLAEDPDCERMWGNAEAYRQLGADEAEAVAASETDPALGRILDVRLAGKCIEGIEIRMRRAAQHGIATRDEELEVLLSDGRRSWLSLSATPVLDDTGALRGAVGASLDITRIKAFEADLLQHKEELEDEVHERTRALVDTHQQLREMERMATIGTLSAGLGHDMGNLLLPLRLRLDSLNSLNLPEPAQSDLEAIGKVVEYLQRLTTGLRSLAVDPKVDRARNAETRLKTWWADVQNLMKNALPPSVILDAIIPTRLPLVRMSAAALTQAVLNVLQNAGHALQGRRDGRITLRVSHVPSEDQVRITVSDNGPGLDDEAMRRCFEPFFSTKKRQISTGLGLAVVRALIMGAGGEVSVASRLGEGATFTFTLPVDRRKPQRNREVVPTRQALLSIADPRQRALLSSVLRHDGFEVKLGEPRADGQYLLFISDGASDRGHGQLKAFVAHDARRIGLLVNASETGPSHPQIRTLRSASDVTGLRAMLHEVAGGEDGDRQKDA